MKLYFIMGHLIFFLLFLRVLDSVLAYSTQVRVGEDGNPFLPMCIRLTLRRDSLLLVSPLLVVLFEIGRVIYCWRRQSMFHLTGILLWQRFMLSNKELNLLLQGYRSVLMEQSDNSPSISALQGHPELSPYHQLCVEDILDLCSVFQYISFLHVGRMANNLALTLSKLSFYCR